ncbi:hypothetical protein J2X45_001709 [Caulobacter sp. BE264]|uniref:bifunctional DNA primase/polymerase n=1 Tax=Caulobacter sp. BE264 TaxID=2817724 RepID=UPI002867698E|nr:bifunctional DNA primase/polymerase [Caulobacter sp. BE264]MDR7230618.1 hypothetical protein [Caulobacter sp. BE264]
MSQFLRAAMDYARRGIAVFPLQPRDKAPYGRTIGFKQAAHMPGLVEDWWTGRRCLELKPDAKNKAPVRARIDSNIGIATGAISGFWVLDLDGPEAEAAIARLEALHGPLPKTVQQATGRGRHLCFAWNPAFPVRNMSKRSQERIGAKIDVRGDGGYIVAPPSVHPGKPEEGIPPGRIYAWTPGCSPQELAFAEAPAWLLELVCPPPEPEPVRAPIKPRAPAAGRASAYGEAALDGAVRTIHGARVGSRDTTLYRASCSIGCLIAGGEIDHDYGRSVLIEAGRVHVPDAMTVAQLERQVDRALAWGESRPRSAGERPRQRSVQTERQASATKGVEAIREDGATEAARLWDSARSAWCKATTHWFEARGLAGTPCGATEVLNRFRVHPNAPIGGGRTGPSLIAPLVRQDGDPIEALAVLPFEADRITHLVGDSDGRVVMLTPLRPGHEPESLIVALDLQDAWYLLTQAWREEISAGAVIAPRLSTFAGGALGDRWGRIDPDAPAHDPTRPPWRASDQRSVWLAVRRDIRGPEMRARAFGGGSRPVRLEGDEASRFYGGLATQAWQRPADDFNPANRVRVIGPLGTGGFNVGGQV